MELRKEQIGKKTFCRTLNSMVEICEENKQILIDNGLFRHFITDIELKPLVKEPEAKKVIGETILGTLVAPSETADKIFLLDKISREALNNFEGRTPKEVKKDLDLLGIEYPKNCGMPKLIEIIKTL